MKHLSFLLISLAAFLPSLIFFSCQKGEPVNMERYMKLDVEAYYEDPSLFSTVSFNGKELVRDASEKEGGDITDLLVSPAEIQMPARDSGKLEITIIKKNNPNLVFDSIINVSHFNDFLLVQLDPLQAPKFINKNIASATIPQPTNDSIKARFYFSSNDPNLRNNNYSPATVVTRVDLEIWALKEVEGIKQPVNINRKFRVNANQLSDEYFSFKKGEQYAWRILDVSPNVASDKRVIESFEYDADYEAFTKGFIGLTDQTNFQTVKIMQTFDDFLFQPGLNGKYLFGFQ